MYSDSHSPPHSHQPLPTNSFPGFMSLGFILSAFSLPGAVGCWIGAAHSSPGKSLAVAQLKAMDSSLPGSISCTQFMSEWMSLPRPSSILTLNRPVLCRPGTGTHSSSEFVITVVCLPKEDGILVLLPGFQLLHFFLLPPPCIL